MNAARFFMSITAATLMAACATVADEPFSFKDGWRHGTIEQIGLPPDMARPVYGLDCRPDSPGQTFVAVHFRHGRSTHVRWVPLPGDTSLKKGDRVWVRVNQCDAPLLRAQFEDPPAMTR